MKKYIILLFALISWFAKGQDYDFQELCIACVEQNGYYCGDDPANWTQYSPMGCVPNGAGGLEYLNDGWEDCADGSDENGAVPTSPEDCAPPIEECDTVYIEIPVIEYEYITEYDTIVEYETIVVYDTITEIEYIEVVVTEYIDCDSGLPCNSGMEEVIDKSTGTNIIYNLLGQPIRKPQGIYIEDGQVKKISE